MKEKNINVSLKSIWWMDKDEDGAGRPFLRAGFSNTAEILELRVYDMLNIMGIDRIMVGTDYPYESPRKEMEFLSSLALTPEEREILYHKNEEAMIEGSS